VGEGTRIVYPLGLVCPKSGDSGVGQVALLPVNNFATSNFTPITQTLISDG